MRRAVISVVLGAFFAAGCGDDSGNIRALPDIALEPKAVLEFPEACPKPPADSPFEAEPSVTALTLTNNGRNAAENITYTIEGVGKDLFSIDPATPFPTSIPASESRTVNFFFLPLTGGTATAELRIHVPDNTDREDFTITLTGQGSNLPPTPQMTVSCLNQAAFPGTDPCEPLNTDPTRVPKLIFKETLQNGNRIFEITVGNNGCPNLRLESFTFEPVEEDGEPIEAGAFSLAEGQASTVVVAGGGTEQVLKIAFAPKTTDEARSILVFNTNDPLRPTVRFELQGQGTEPRIRFETDVYCGNNAPAYYYRCCDFRALQPGTCTGRFDLRNVGSEPITVRSVALERALSMFTVTKVPEAGVTIPPNGKLQDAVLVTYTPEAVLDQDSLIADTDGGRAFMQLLGGSPPVLDLEPTNILDFNDDPTDLLDPAGVFYRTVLVRNKEQYNLQLPLVVSSLPFEPAPSANAPPLFSMAEPSLCADQAPAGVPSFALGGEIAAGEAALLCVQCDPYDSGGVQAGNAKFHSNDPVWGGGRQLEIICRTWCNANPTPLVTRVLRPTCDECTGECIDGACHTANLTVTVTQGGENTITLSAIKSFDSLPLPEDKSKCEVEDSTRIQAYQWCIQDDDKNPFLEVMPSAAELQQRELKLKFKKSGVFEGVYLRVQDDSGTWSHPEPRPGRCSGPSFVITASDQ